VRERLSPLGRAVGSDVLLHADEVSASYGSQRQRLVLDRVSLSVSDGECLAIVGESGSGKTTLARCIAGLHRPQSGAVVLNGERLAASIQARSADERRAIQLIYQNPDRSLNPRRSVGDQIGRPLRLFGIARGRDVNREVAHLIERVRLPATIAARFPTELSGGEKQRVAIARALAARPALLLCDEVTSALDVSVQAAVLDLLAELRRDQRLSMIYISHDLAVVATIADRIIVLHNGELCEEGPAPEVIARPHDDYTRMLIAASPELPATAGSD
jgi:peptide/nickel transport system ATP-binding protein